MVPQLIRQMVKMRDGLLCRYRFLNPRCEYSNEHIDHRWPLARGGADSPSNLQFICASCNLEKGTLTAEEFEVQLIREAALRHIALSQPQPPPSPWLGSFVPPPPPAVSFPMPAFSPFQPAPPGISGNPFSPRPPFSSPPATPVVPFNLQCLLEALTRYTP